MAITNNDPVPNQDPPVDGTTGTKTALNQDPPADDAEVGSGDLNQDGAPEEPAEGEKKVESAPDAYEAFKLPEGAEADEAQLAAFNEVARELNLSQDAAQKLIDFEVERVKQQQESAAKYWTDQIAEWLVTSKSDPEIGGKGWNDTLKHANVFVAQFGNDGLREVMETIGLGNHPEVLRAFARAGRAMSEDAFVKGNGGVNNAPKSRADVLYGS
ncbi:MAG: peptidase [Chloroflexi bacterium]|nr:peptidase [Chloroflexota bacterium]